MEGGGEGMLVRGEVCAVGSSHLRCLAGLHSPHLGMLKQGGGHGEDAGGGGRRRQRQGQRCEDGKGVSDMGKVDADDDEACGDERRMGYGDAKVTYLVRMSL